MFAAIYKILPDRHLEWRNVILGGMITAFLFTLGKFLISFYLGSSAVGSTYGAAGALVIILLWIYYSASSFSSVRNSQKHTPTIITDIDRQRQSARLLCSHRCDVCTFRKNPFVTGPGLTTLVDLYRQRFRHRSPIDDRAVQRIVR